MVIGIKGRELEADILRFCKDSYNQLKPLVETNGYPKSTVYKIVARLVKEGSLEKVDNTYKATDEGIDRITTSHYIDKSVFIDNELAEISRLVPHLKYFPTSIHRLFVVGVMGGIAARIYLTQDASYPNFALFGPIMRWKSKTGKMILLMHGADLTNFIDCRPESGKSLTIRRGRKGNIESMRNIMKSNVVIFDEFNEADKAVKRDIRTFLHGEKNFSFENEMIEITATPVVTANPLEGSTAMEKLGIHEATLRRLICTDITNVIIPESIKEKGEEYLKAVRELPPLEIKKPLPDELFTDTGILKRVIKRSIKNYEDIRMVDYNMIMAMVRGISAYLNDAEKAERLGLVCYLGLMETTNFIKPSWPDILQDELKKKDGSKQTKDTHDKPNHVIPTSQCNYSEYDYSGKVRSIVDLLQNMGADVDEIEAKLEEAETLRQFKDFLDYIGIDSNEVVHGFPKMPDKLQDDIKKHISLFKESPGFDIAVCNQWSKYKFYLISRGQKKETANWFSINK